VGTLPKRAWWAYPARMGAVLILSVGIGTMLFVGWFIALIVREKLTAPPRMTDDEVRAAQIAALRRWR